MVEKWPLKFADVNRDPIVERGFCGQSTFFIKENGGQGALGDKTGRAAMSAPAAGADFFL